MNDFFQYLLYLPPQASTIAERIDRLHYYVISSTMIGATGVALVVAIFIALYRRRRADDVTPHINAPLWLEALFIGGLGILFISFWVLGYKQYIEVRAEPQRALTVYVEGKQWMWKFADASGRASAGRLVVPAHTPVRLVITSRDVIHSFYIPAFRIKMDAVPGRTTTTWFTATRPGTYAILCAEYCGADHSRMRGEVHVLSPEQYATWIETAAPVSQADQVVTDPSLEELIPTEGTRPLAEIGENVATRFGCLSCHSVDGGRRIGPTWRGLYGGRSQLTSGETVIADEAYITRSIMQPMTDIVVGFPPVMPTYQGRITAGEIAAILEYIRSLELPVPADLPPEIPQVDVPLSTEVGAQPSGSAQQRDQGGQAADEGSQSTEGAPAR